MRDGEWWAHAEEGDPRVQVNPTTWGIILDAYLVPWVRHVFDLKRRDLICPHHNGGEAAWSDLGASVQRIQGMRSLALSMRTYANSRDGTQIRPSRATLAAAQGYSEHGTDGIDQHLGRLERYGWIDRYRKQGVPGGYVNVYRTTVPTALAQELPEQWHAEDMPRNLATHVAVIDSAMEDARARAARSGALRLAYQDTAA